MYRSHGRSSRQPVANPGCPGGGVRPGGDGRRQGPAEQLIPRQKASCTLPVRPSAPSTAEYPAATGRRYVTHVRLLLEVIICALAHGVWSSSILQCFCPFWLHTACGDRYADTARVKTLAWNRPRRSCMCSPRHYLGKCWNLVSRHTLAEPTSRACGGGVCCRLVRFYAHVLKWCNW